ncbi:ligand-gated channel [Methylophaga thalassica]|uniref:Ligand-gated channel n=1 Tax=Methylophaga thalassica TaxID=40223 RepID=A0ABQ5TS34_9GAMM|nr:ligand-gated channel [Methylophaga thalassica]
MLFDNDYYLGVDVRIYLNKISQPTMLTLAVLAGLSTQPVSAETLELDTLNVVSNTVTPETNSVNAEQIEKLQPNDLEDLFSQSPEVSIGGGTDLAQKLYVRGIEDQLLNISIDGAVQATRLYHHAGRISVEPELLKRVEVNAGAGNALSGAGALGGSVKFVTKDPEDMLKPGEKLGGLVKGMFSSNTDSFKTNTSLFGRLNDDWSAMVSATSYNPSEYEDGNGDEIEGTKFDQDFLFAKVVGQLTDSQKVRLSYQKRTDEGDRANRPQWIVSSFNRIQPYDLERETVTFNYELNPLDNQYIDLGLTLYNIKSELDRSGADAEDPFIGAGESKGFDLRNSSLIGMHKVTYGMDYRRDETYAGPPSDKQRYEENATVKGLYIQDDIQLTEDLLLSAGLRYDKYKLEDRNDVEFDESEVSPNIGLNYHFTDNWSAFASYAEAFKGPLSPDAYKLYSGSNDPNLKPEDASNIEFGLEYGSESWFGSAKIYRSKIDDLIADELFGPVYYTNVGDLESDGYIVEIGHRWDKVMARVSYHHNNAEIDGKDASQYGNNGAATSIGDLFLAQVDYELSSELSLGWNAKFVKGDSVDAVAPGIAEGTKIDKPGYGVHDLYAQWHPSSYRDIEVTLTVRNIFDKYYLDHATNASWESVPDYEGIKGLPEPGRDVRLSVAWQF